MMKKLALVGLVILALPTLGRAANLLVYGGFELDNIQTLADAVRHGPNNDEFWPGVWGVEEAVRVMDDHSGIMPQVGYWMLKMDDDGLIATQAFQFVDITGFGNLFVEAGYNSDAPAARASLTLTYYENPNDWGNAISLDNLGMDLDGDVSTWEKMSFQSTVPDGATWVAVHVAFTNVSIEPDFSGFVDKVSLIPEPASILLLGVGLAALVGRRRRK